jgi:UDP-sulfoquinovose synthase
LELGLQPHYFTDEVIHEMLHALLKYKNSINRGIIMPRVSW